MAPLARADGRRDSGARDAAPPAWRLYVPLVPFVLIQTTLRLRWHGIQNLYDDWANVSYYGLFFLLGFCAARRPAWEDVIAREWRRAGAIGLGAAAAMIGGWWLRGGLHWPIELTRPSLETGVPLLALSGVTGYCIVVAIVGAAREYLCGAALNDAPRIRAARRYLTEAALPIYVLHQLAVVAFGYVIVGLALTIPSKMVLQLTGAVAATFAAYHYGVRPVPAARALLGMKGGSPAAPLGTPIHSVRAA
jgi:hypothetical protein